jgi:hypothetical protein
LFLALVVAALVLAGLKLASVERRSGTSAVRIVEVPAGEVAHSMHAAREVSDLPAAEPGESAGEYLAGYWGPSWPEIRARMEAAGVDLEVPFEPTAWELVEAEFRARACVDPSMRAQIPLDKFAWNEKPDNAWLRNEFPGAGDFELGPAELEQLAALVELERLEFAPFAEAYVERLDFHLRASFEQGKYQRVPYTNRGLAEAPGYYSTSIAGHGWAVALTLHAEDCPDVLQLEADMAAMTRRRDQRVEAFLKQHPRR